jgi:hypothetical protein
MACQSGNPGRSSHGIQPEVLLPGSKARHLQLDFASTVLTPASRSFLKALDLFLGPRVINRNESPCVIQAQYMKRCREALDRLCSCPAWPYRSAFSAICGSDLGTPPPTGSTRSLTFAEPMCIACILRRNVCHQGLIFHFIDGSRVPGPITHLHGPSLAMKFHRYGPFSVIDVPHGPGYYSLGVSQSVPDSTLRLSQVAR